MKFSKKFLFLIGTALCVVPIFSVVQAQQGSNEARMMLQMQEMQAEIAQLRDMVERQQFQLKGMQRKMQQAELNASRPSMIRPDIANSDVANGPMSQGADDQDNTSDGSLTDEEKWLFNSSAPVVVDPSQRTADSTISTGAEDEGLYGTPATTDSEAVYGDGSTVEERVITVPPLSRTGSQASYPPVEDRSVGTEARADYPNTSTIQGSSARDAVEQLDTRANSFPPLAHAPSGTIDARQIPTEPVIAVPDLAASDSPLVNNSRVGAQPLEPVVDPSVLAEQEYYRQGFDLVKQSKFKEAIQMFLQLIDNHPNGELSGDAYYWIGEAGFLDRDLVTSKQYFRTFMDSYPQSARIPGAMLRTAYIEQEQGNLIEARILLNEIIQYHPSSDAVHAAKNRLADIENKGN